MAIKKPRVGLIQATPQQPTAKGKTPHLGVAGHRPVREGLETQAAHHQDKDPVPMKSRKL